MLRRNKKATIAAMAIALTLGSLSAAACTPTPTPASDATGNGAASQDASAGDSEDGTAAGTAAMEAIEVTWSPDADCAICHTAEGESMTLATTGASQHETSQCVDCHDNADVLATMHEGKTTADLAPKRLKKTHVAEEACTPCHSREDIQAKGAASTVLTDVNGLVANPHDLPAHESHSEIRCSDCHKLHDDTAELTDDAQKLCASCHHSGVYECYTCHEHD